MDRRQFMFNYCVVSFALIFAEHGCNGSSGAPAPSAPTAVPTQPNVPTTSLLTRVQNQGFTSARSVRYENFNAYQIYINDSNNWRFWLGDTPLSVGGPDQYSLNVPLIAIPDNQIPRVT